MLADIFDYERRLRRFCESKVAELATTGCEARGITGDGQRAIVDAVRIIEGIRAMEAGVEAREPRACFEGLRDGEELSYLSKV